VRDNPVAAAAALRDPKQFPDLDPVLREQYINQAQAAADVRQTDQLTNAARFNPASVTMQIGRVIDPRHVVDLFDRGVIKQESEGDPTAVSNKGALGIAQVMPNTAREVLRGLGRAELANLDDAALKKKLLEDPGLNRQIGLTYFQQQVATFNGSIPAALAAYNAGPRKAAEWQKLAVAKFGDNFTPAQFASVVSYGETRNYILKVYGHMGVAPEGVQLSPHALARATTIVGNEINAQNAAQSQILKSLADTQRSDNNIIEIYKAGFSVDPETEAAMVSTQRAAAARNDPAAAKWLREYEIVRAHAPFIQAAYAMPLPQLEAMVRQHEAQLAQSPNVTHADKVRMDAFKAVLDNVHKRRNDDPRSLGERGRLFSPVAIDPNFKPDDPAALQSIAIAGQQAAFAARHYGSGEIKVFKPEEAAAIKARVGQMQDGDRVQFVSAMLTALPDEMVARAALTQAGFDAKTIAAANVTRNRPDLLREILEGQNLLKEEGTKPKAEMLRNAASAALGGKLWEGKSEQDAVTDAAVALYVARRGKTEALYSAPDPSALQSAIEEIAGKKIRRGGVPVLAPPVLGASAFTAMLDNLDGDALLPFGGAYDRNGQPFDPAWLGRNAQLKQDVPGGSRYLVLVNDAAVTTYDQRPLIIDARRLEEYFRGRKAQAPQSLDIVAP
jgi:hypothetical protein